MHSLLIVLYLATMAYALLNHSVPTFAAIDKCDNSAAYIFLMKRTLQKSYII